MRALRVFKFAAAATLAVGLAASVSTATIAEPATTNVTTPRQCFWAREVRNFAYVDDSTINLRVGNREVYQLTTFGRCSDIDFTHRIRLETYGFSSVCNAHDVDLIVPTNTGPVRCAVRAMRKLTPEEVAALPSRERP